MMTINNEISNQTIAHNILKELKRSGHKKFVARPWNHFKPDTTLWWLVPSTDWPSYKYGKIIIDKSETKHQIGLNIEKGVAPVAAQMLSPGLAKSLCIQSDWVWHKLLKDVKNGNFEKVLDGISRDKNRPLKVIIEALTIEEKGSQVHQFEGLNLKNVITFDYINSVLSCNTEDIKGILRNYDYIDSFDQLADIFEAEDMEWLWIDFFILFEINEQELDESIDCAISFIDNYKELFV